jgi:hypothetical protein
VSVVAKLVAFLVVLVLCFGAAYAVGAAVGPIGDDGEPAGVTTSTTMPMGHDQEHGS